MPGNGAARGGRFLPLFLEDLVNWTDDLREKLCLKREGRYALEISINKELSAQHGRLFDRVNDLLDDFESFALRSFRLLIILFLCLSVIAVIALILLVLIAMQAYGVPKVSFVLSGAGSAGLGIGFGLWKISKR